MGLAALLLLPQLYKDLGLAMVSPIAHLLLALGLLPEGATRRQLTSCSSCSRRRAGGAHSSISGCHQTGLLAVMRGSRRGANLVSRCSNQAEVAVAGQLPTVKTLLQPGSGRSACASGRGAPRQATSS